jgi:truncated hemoglobin YjbI
MPKFCSVNVTRPSAPAAGGRDDRAVGPHWAWDTTFLGTLTATLRKETVGVTADGLRINWHVVEGRFVGPGFDSTVLPGAADWMRIRSDGIGIVNVHACFETSNGARVYGSYAGHFDLGEDGYARALREEYAPLPPVVVTPTYATADPELAWLNRVQCFGVGRVDMKAFRVQFDVYVVRVGERAGRSAPDAGTLYTRMGGYDVIAPMARDFIRWIVEDDRLKRLFAGGYTEARIDAIRQHVVDFLCQITGGSCVYTGRDMKTTHLGLGITDDDWKTAANLLTAALDKYRVPAREQTEFMDIIASMKGDIIDPAAG